MRRIMLAGLLIFGIAAMSYGLVGENIIASYNFAIRHQTNQLCTVNNTGILYFQNQGDTSVWINVFGETATNNDIKSTELLKKEWIDFDETVFRAGKVINIAGDAAASATCNIVGWIRKYVGP